MSQAWARYARKTDRKAENRPMPDIKHRMSEREALAIVSEFSQIVRSTRADVEALCRDLRAAGFATQIIEFPF